MNIENNLNTISLEIKRVFCENIKIKEANKYDLAFNNNINFNKFINFITNLDNCLAKQNDIDFLINDISIKNSKIAKKYLQQNCLILSKKSYLNENISVENNIKVVSTIFSGFNLSNAVISSFNLKNIKNKKIKDLTTNEKQLIILSYCVACPALIWFIDGNLLYNLTDKNKHIFENVVKIRIKQGGVVLILN